MENLLQGVPNVVVRIDDILIAGKTSAKHFNSLNEVLSRLEKVGIRLKRSKYIFQAPESLTWDTTLTKMVFIRSKERSKLLKIHQGLPI